MVTPTPSDRIPDLFEPRSAIETPALVVDLEVMERNVEALAAVADAHGVALRSHAKTQKIAEIARYQDRVTGGGILCQTLGEAEVMAAHGLDDIHLVRMAVAPRKLDRLVWLAGRIDRFATTVDGTGNLGPLAEAAERRQTPVGVVVEVDCGLGRTGTTPEGAVPLARTIEAHPRLAFEGILGHDGFLKARASSRAEFESLCEGVVDVLERTVSALDDADLEVPAVKTGSSATARFMATQPVVTELNPGRYAFWDALHLDLLEAVTREDCAVTVLATVISTPTADRAVVDVGSKALSAMASPAPVPRRRDDVAVGRLSSEHMVLDTGDAEPPVRVGDRLEFIVPSVIHAINLHDALVGLRGDRVEAVYDVQARGKYR